MSPKGTLGVHLPPTQPQASHRLQAFLSPYKGGGDSSHLLAYQESWHPRGNQRGAGWGTGGASKGTTWAFQKHHRPSQQPQGRRAETLEQV